MCETEQYVPSIDKDGFITKSTQAVLGVLSKLKWKEGEGQVPKRQSFFKTMLYIPIYFTYCLFKKLCIFINYGRRNYSYTCNLSGRNNETDTFGNIWSSTFFCTNTFTGSVYRKSADFTHYQQPKCLYPLHL